MKTGSCSQIVALLLGALSCYGTTVVVMRTTDGILVAADAKVVDKRSNLPPQCKIRQYGKVFVAIAGITKSEAVGFDAEHVVRIAAVTPGPLLSKVEAFRISARKYLLEDVEYEKRSSRSSYIRDYLGKRILDVTFATMNGPNAEAVVQTFFVDGAGVLHDQQSPLGGHLVLVTGLTSAIKSYTEQNSDWYKRLGPDVAIKKFMELELASKKNAAGPVSIIKMGVGGARWVEQGACPAIRN